MPEKSPEKFSLARFKTPIGVALLVTDAHGLLCALDWEDFEDRLIRLMRQQHGETALSTGKSPRDLTSALKAYFDGDLSSLRGIKCRLAGTPFQRCVWSALRRIPAGSTTSYGVLAERIDRPTAVRAVGHANGSNPISVVVPCHRVIGADGSLTGYGGGLDRKRWLLKHEGVAISE